MPELEKYKGSVYLWSYIPSLPLSVTFTILFALLTIAHTYKMLRTRLWICVPFVIGGLCNTTPFSHLPITQLTTQRGEPIGYACRAIATYYTGSLIPFILQGIFLLLPPVLFAASLYMVYARVVRAVHGEKYSPISLRWCTRLFVLGDWFCLNVQSSGAGLLANPKHTHIGDGIIVAGLGIQCVIFVGFMWCCICFHVRFRTSGEGKTDVPWESMLWMLYTTSTLILVRNGFRLVEYVMGKDTYLFEHEWPIYVFDGALMLIVMVVFLVWYPSQLQERSTESMIELTSEGGMEEEQQRRGRPDDSELWTPMVKAGVRM
jgi:hypothetical protein